MCDMRKLWGHIFLGMLFLQFLAMRSYAQQLKLGNYPTSINRSAVLQLDSRNQGLLLTRIEDTALINFFTPLDGMIIYFTDSQSVAQPYGPHAGVYQRKNGGWRPLWIGYGKNGQVLRTVGPDSLPIWEDLGLDSLFNVKLNYPVNNKDVLMYDGTNWVNVSNVGSGWLLSGNTVSSDDFLGTTNYEPLIFKVNGIQAGYLGTPGTSSNVAFGIGSSANFKSVAIGGNAIATHNESVALGYTANSDAFQSIAIGSGAQTSINNSTIAIGTQANASGYQSTAMGSGASATAQNSTAIGNGATANQFNTLILGDNKVKVGIRTSNPQYPLDVNGTIRGSNVTPSDIRYKKNLQELSNVLSDIDSLHGYTYFFRTEEFKDKNFSKTKQIGMIAQEVEKYFPELVSTDENGYKSLNYAQFTAVLLEAIKEQQAEIDSLKKQQLQQKKVLADQLGILSERIEVLEKQVKHP